MFRGEALPYKVETLVFPWFWTSDGVYCRSAYTNSALPAATAMYWRLFTM